MPVNLVNWPGALGFEIVLGSLLLLSATGIGWAIGRRRNLILVRIVWWWMHAVVLPLLATRSWLQRTLLIFTNNCLVLAAVVASGVWISTATLAISGVGIALGIALRSLGELSPHWSAPSPNCPKGVKRKVRIGVSLNLLEPPAIALAMGLSLGTSAAEMASLSVWRGFGVWVVPLLWVAACGEGLWLGVGLQQDSTTVRDGCMQLSQYEGISPPA